MKLSLLWTQPTEPLGVITALFGKTHPKTQLQRCSELPKQEEWKWERGMKMGRRKCQTQPGPLLFTLKNNKEMKEMGAIFTWEKSNLPNALPVHTFPSLPKWICSSQVKNVHLSAAVQSQQTWCWREALEISLTLASHCCLQGGKIHCHHQPLVLL